MEKNKREKRGGVRGGSESYLTILILGRDEPGLDAHSALRTDCVLTFVKMRAGHRTVPEPWLHYCGDLRFEVELVHVHVTMPN